MGTKSSLLPMKLQSGWILRRKCIDEIVAKKFVLTTGHDKMRVTVMLTANADGKKLKQYVLLSRNRPVPLL
uniref:Uncharacterized protein n=1 Tax=Ditylenchus dipsaci TaxID=166011 RepID=A0A915DUS5_9BILA